MIQNTDSEKDKTDFTRYTLWFAYACIVYSIIGFSWGALMGGRAGFRQFITPLRMGISSTLRTAISICWDG